MKGTLFTNGQLFLPDGRFAKGSLVVEGGLIAEVLPDGEDLPGATVIDLAGRALIPGFVDSHTHFISITLKRLRCDLSGAISAAEVCDRLARWGRENAGGGPVVGVEWDDAGWSDGTFPTRETLDAIARDRPVYARRVCMHVGVVNSAFLEMLHGADSFVDRETGFITEDAVVEANRLSYPPRDSVVTEVEGAIGDLHRLGITGIHDMIAIDNPDSYLEGVRASRAPIRIDAMVCTDTDGYDDMVARASDLDRGLFRPVGIKLFTDGSLGGRTAALNSSYSDAQTIGEFLVDEESLGRTLRRCYDKGITCAVHAIGDRALRAVLLEMMKFPRDNKLFRIEHAELTGWDEVRMLQRSPVYVSMQPNFVRLWQQPGGLYEKRLGKARWRNCNRFGSLRDAGVEFMFGSDAMPSGPLYGMRGATHHPVEEERLSLVEAIRYYTAEPSRLGANPRRTGELAPGCEADLVVLSGDVSAGDPDALRVDSTYVGGERVYRRTNS